MAAYVSPRPPEETRRDEAGAEEVAALGAVLQRQAHVPAPRSDEDDDDELVFEHVDSAEDEHPVLPRQRDEFTCGRCFLVAHISRRGDPGSDVCRDCS